MEYLQAANIDLDILSPRSQRALVTIRSPLDLSNTEFDINNSEFLDEDIFFSDSHVINSSMISVDEYPSRIRSRKQSHPRKVQQIPSQLD